MASARDILINLLGKETVSPAARKAGDAVEDLGDEMRDTARDAKKLDGEIDGLQKSLAGLAAAYAAAGTAAERADIAKSIRVDQRQLRQLTGVRKLLQGAGDEGARGFFAAFSTRIGPLMASAPISPPIIAAAVAAAPVVASTLAGAVTAGIGLGAVAAGVALAAKDPAVQAEAKSLGDEVGRALTSSTRPFVPAVIKAVGVARAQFRDLDDDLAGIFADAARYVEPLSQGLAGAARELAPGIRDAVRGAEPLVDMLEDHIPAAAAAVSSALSDLAATSEESANTISAILTASEASIAGVGKGVNLLSKLNHYVGSGPLKSLGDAVSDNKNKVEEATGAVAGWDASFRNFADSAGHAKIEVISFTEAIDRWTSRNLSAENANLRLQAAIDAATAAGKKNNDGIDANTEKGRANRQVLIDLADAANANAQAIYEQTGSTEKANAATAAARKQFIAAAIAMGVGATEAERLAGMLFAIPSPKPKVTLNTKQAKAEAQVIQSAINGIHGKNVTVGVYFVTHGRNKGDLKVPHGTLTKDRWGGTHIPMAAGGVMSAGIYPASSPPLIQFAEPATGGEAYIPRRGNPARSKQILGTAADWYGLDVVPRGTGVTPRGSGARAGLDEDRIGRAVARALAGATFQIDDRRARLATVYARRG